MEVLYSSFNEAVCGSLTRAEVETLQINVGKLCNQTCMHCHVDAGPRRTEIMSADTARDTLRLLDRFPSITTVDITGGAPELNPNFRDLVRESQRRNKTVLDRCNLTVLFEPGQEDLGAFLAEHQVGLIASLPCYLEDNVDQQRGKGVYRKSIDALRLLNRLGYGTGGSLELCLVYNPVGLGLPPAQQSLEADYKRHLEAEFDVHFDRLLTLTNMPISRFERFLRTTGQLEAYQQKLEEAFNPATVPQLMCRTTLSVSWEGFLYDCDFNQMLDMKIESQNGGLQATDSRTENPRPLTVRDLTPEVLRAIPIRTARHCFGCTAGAGSSCTGALATG